VLWSAGRKKEGVKRNSLKEVGKICRLFLPLLSSPPSTLFHAPCWKSSNNSYFHITQFKSI